MRELVLAVVLAFFLAGRALAVPDIVGVTVSDVTPNSFCLVWMTDVAASPTAEVYADPGMATRLNEQLNITPMPDAPVDVAQAARGRGIMKVRVAGLLPGMTYHARGVTADPADPLNIGYSPLMEVTTATATILYKAVADGKLQGMANDLLAFPVYIRPAEAGDRHGLGDLVLLATVGSDYPVSAFVGSGSVSAEGVIDLNNLYGSDHLSRTMVNGETVTLQVYRGGALATLLHYRLAPVSSGVAAVQGPVKGFFADLNLDRKVDDADFALFRDHYKTLPNDATYNPDFNFDNDPTGQIDVRDFSRFAPEYGRTDVH